MTQEHIDQTSRLDQLKFVYSTAQIEHDSTSFLKKALLVATLGSLAFEWGTGNEALLGAVGGNIQQSTHNSLAAGFGTGAVSFAEQGIIGSLMAITISNYPKVTGAIRSLRSSSPDNSEVASKSKFGSVVKPMILGSAMELVVDNARNERSKGRNLKRALGSSAIIGAGNTVIVGGISSVLNISADHGLESQTHAFESIVANPLTYAGIIAGVFGFNKIRQRITARRTADPDFNELAQKELKTNE